MAKVTCTKCGKEVDGRGIRLHEKNCKGKNPQQPAQTGKSVKSQIKVQKPKQPAQKPKEQPKNQQQPAQKKGFLSKLFEDDGDEIL